MSILVINAGSSSWKFSLFDDAARNVLGHKTVSGEGLAEAAIADFLAGVGGGGEVKIVGHRVVHGGTRFSKPTRLDDGVIAELEKLSELAPLHNPPALAGIAAARRALPGAGQIAVFDTAFYADLAPAAYVYAVPYEWYSDWGIRRFGFHGISHSYCAQRATEMLAEKMKARSVAVDHPEMEKACVEADSAEKETSAEVPCAKGDSRSGASRSGDSRLVICHLGNGASATAVRGGRAVATTMGFTPMEGLVMGTRCGSIDPGILIHVMRHRGVGARELDDILNHQSGLKGICGTDSDMRKVEAAAAKGDERASLALEIFCNSVRGAVGSLATAMGGLDGLIFTAGIGENSSVVRRKVCDGLECLGLRLDPSRNAGGNGPNCEASSFHHDRIISRDESGGAILVIYTQEEMQIARICVFFGEK